MEMAVKAARRSRQQRRVLDLAAGGVHDQVRDEQRIATALVRSTPGRVRDASPRARLAAFGTSKTPVTTKTPTMRQLVTASKTGATVSKPPTRSGFVGHSGHPSSRRGSDMRTPSGARTSQAQYKPTDQPPFEARLEPTTREREEEVHGNHQLEAPERREHRVGEGRVPVELSRGNCETERDHEQSDTVPRTAMQGNEPGGDPDAGVHDLATTLSRSGSKSWATRTSASARATSTNPATASATSRRPAHPEPRQRVRARRPRGRPCE